MSWHHYPETTSVELKGDSYTSTVTDIPSATVAVASQSAVISQLIVWATARWRIMGPGIWGPPTDKAAALATLCRAIELGVNLIDTADSYGPYVSEQLIAEALFPYPAGLVIATKGGWDRPGPGLWTHNASPRHLAEAVEGSLKRLRLDRIDVYQLHMPDNNVSFEASVEALENWPLRSRFRWGLIILSMSA